MKSQFTKGTTSSRPSASRSERWSARQLAANIARPTSIPDPNDETNQKLRKREMRSTFTRLDSLLLDLP